MCQYGGVSSSRVQLSMSGTIISCSFSSMSVLVFDLSDLKRVREVIRALKISKQWCNVMGVMGVGTEYEKRRWTIKSREIIVTNIITKIHGLCIQSCYVHQYIRIIIIFSLSSPNLLLITKTFSHCESICKICKLFYLWYALPKL